MPAWQESRDCSSKPARIGRRIAGIGGRVERCIMGVGHKRGWIGIEFGSRTLRAAQLERGRTGLRFAASARVPWIRPAGDEPGSSEADYPWSARDILSALSLRDDFRGRRAACVLPMSLVDLHALTLPPGDPFQRRAMVAHELSEIFAGEDGDRLFDYWEAEPGTSRSSANLPNVKVLSAPRRLVQRVARDVSRAKLTCEVMDGLPCVVARAVALAYGSAPKALVGAVDWGHASATFTAVHAGQSLYARNLRNSGAGRLVESVSQALGLSMDETAEVLETYGLPDPEVQDAVRREIQEVIAEVAATHLREMVEDLKKTISYLQMQYADISLERLCLLGEGATVRNVATHLSERLGLPVDTWHLPEPTGETGMAADNHPALFANSAALSALAWNS